MWLGKNGLPLLTVGQNPGDNTIRLNSIYTGVPFSTQMYAQITVHYNMDDNEVCLDYAGERILDWTDAGGSVNTQFNTFGISRLSAGAGTEGKVYFDNVVVETFLDSTVAWWRFEEDTGSTSSEQLGRFAPAAIIGYSSEKVRSSSNPLHTGESDVANRFARSQPILEPMTNEVGSIVMTNWTLEAVIRVITNDPSYYNSQIISWGTGIGEDTNTFISCSWQSDEAGVALTLHDSDPIPSGWDYVWAIENSLPADGKWHHFAMVKTGSTVVVHIDYTALSTNNLDSKANGTYIFDTQSRVTIGKALNNGNTSDPGHIFDEVRLSSRALTPNEFLHLGRPLFRNVPDNPGSPTWNFDVWTIPNEEYAIETTDDLAGPSGWHIDEVFTASNHISVISTPQPTETNGFLRLLRNML